MTRIGSSLSKKVIKKQFYKDYSNFNSSIIPKISNTITLDLNHCIQPYFQTHSSDSMINSRKVIQKAAYHRKNINLPTKSQFHVWHWCTGMNTMNKPFSNPNQAESLAKTQVNAYFFSLSCSIRMYTSTASPPTSSSTGGLLNWFPELESDPNLQEMQKMEQIISHFLSKNSIKDELHGHFESLMKFGNKERIIQFLTEDIFDFEDTLLDSYLRFLNLMYGTHGEGSHEEEALKILRQLVAENYPPALETQAIYSYDTDYQASITYHKRASDAGFLESNINYGCYLIDNATDRYVIKSGVDLIVHAANKNYLPAALFLARLFCMGRRLISPNSQLCYSWGQIAMDLGSIEGAGFVGIRLIAEKESPENVEYGRKLLQTAADAGYIDMIGHYGYLAMGFLGQTEEGVKYLKDYVERDDCLPHTLFVMGECYLKGIHVDQDADKAIAIFEKGASQRDIMCLITLAELYANGFDSGDISIVPDFERAAIYYEMCVKYHKSEEAQRKLDMYAKYKRF